MKPWLSTVPVLHSLLWSHRAMEMAQPQTVNFPEQRRCKEAAWPGDSPDPMTFSILIREASISRVNSCTAWQGSSYVWGST